MKRTIIITFLALVASVAGAQTADWQQVSKLIGDGSYRTAYSRAEAVFRSTRADSRQRLTAAFYMAQAGAAFQEDARDSAEARYRALLPQLAGVEKALCHAFLGEYDSALADTLLLQRTPVEAVKEFCHSGKTRNMTPTVFDMLVVMMQDRDYDPRRNLALQRRLCAFHAQDADADLRVWHDIRLLQFMANIPNQHINLSTYQQYINKYRESGSELLTQLYHLAAQHCQWEDDYVQAVRYCDTAIALAPKSLGGVDCAGIRANILAKQVMVEGRGLTLMPGVPSPQKVLYGNLDHLWFRVVPYIDDFRWNKDTKDWLLKARPIQQWNLALHGNDSHRVEASYFAIPALKAGRYCLLVSPSADFRTDGFMAYEVHCTDMVHFDLGNGISHLVDRRTGLPIAGQEVRLMRRTGSKDSLLRTTTTDADGRFRFDADNLRWSDYLVAERDGYRLEERYVGNQPRRQPDSSLQYLLRLDRPIYRPADTLHAAVVAYYSDGLDGMAIRGCRLRVSLLDPNGTPVAEDSVLTDEYGMGTVAFVLPTDRMAGQYRLRVFDDGRTLASKTVRVEEYRQPRFMVTLAPTEGGEAPAFGREATVQGLATTYSGVPVGGARVQYTVSRITLSRFGRRFWHTDELAVASGELASDADGSFSISFVPQPDSSVDLNEHSAFAYRVEVDVTDLNGESHNVGTTLRVSYRNAFVSLDQEENEEYRELPQLTFHLSDINGRPLTGTMHVRVERLRRPARTLLPFPAMEFEDSVHHTLGTEEWWRTFPFYARGRHDIYPRMWPVADTTVDGEWRVEDGDLTVRLPQLISGYYRIRAYANGSDTLEHVLCLTRKDARRVQSNSLLWHSIDKRRAEVGERVALQFGSALAGTQVYYMFRVGDEMRVFRRVDCKDDAIHTEYIDVDSTMLGGFSVAFFAVRENVESHWSGNVEVPFSHKKLKMEISTFRDHLLPGQTEEWTIKVGGVEPVEGSSWGQVLPTTHYPLSAVILTMYDDALNSYGDNGSWDFAPWRRHNSPRVNFDGFNDWSYRQMNWLVRDQRIDYRGNYPTVWRLREGLPYHFGRRLYKSNAVMARSSSAGAEVLVSVEEEEVAEEVAFSLAENVVDAAPMATSLSGDMDEAVITASEASAGSFAPEEDEPQVRENLSPLAFFAADIRTDSTGTATYRFTLPDLLTRWNVRGMAYTKDLRVGTLDRTLVASKSLMVQPNMPRFLRHGDSLSIMAKVVFDALPSTHYSLPTEVSFLLTDAATGDTICYQTQVLPTPHTPLSTQVKFDVEVPRSVNVAEYCIMARCGGMSDGERGQIPVVGNRQSVSVSQALFINGVGEKSFHFPLSTYNTPTSEPQLLKAEVVSNPVWLALKCLPHLDEVENPSSLYLADQLYVEALGESVVNHLGNEHLDWAPDTASRDRTVRKLQDMQNDDGGWPWMPEGRSSLWATQQVLERLSTTHYPLPTQNALDFVDREQQLYYEKYVKPYAKKYKWQPTDVDYLYVRSLYGKARTEAYRFYYASALKNYKQYENLYTQAQLALVFHRAGDHKQALDLLRRLKEKALTSDEMGLYWRDNRSGWFWYQRPIETQALLIRAFAEVAPDDTLTLGLMQQWLLKQKHTTHWGNSRATAEAIGALLVRSSELEVKSSAGLVVFGDSVLSTAHHPLPTAGNPEGYASHSWNGDSLESLITHHSSLITITKSTPGIAWGAVVYQYEDDMDRIPAADMGIKISRSYSLVGSGEQKVGSTQEQTTLHVGDRLKVRIEIFADRAMDYLELVDGRPACVEPLSTRAGWRWNDGQAYYVTVNNTDTRFYIEHLDRGHYVAEYEVYVTTPGSFQGGVATMQCLYAPEFRANTPAARLEVH